MRKYNNNIDSIGTEYSPMSESTEGNPLQGSIDYDDYINQSEHIQKGGDNPISQMWNYVSGIGERISEGISETISGKEEEIIDIVNDKDLTAMIMKAIEEGKNETANFLLGYSFVPNMDYLNKKKQNLVHVLINAADRVPRAKDTLKKLIKLPNVRSALSMPDVNNIRPLYSALKNGLHDIAYTMAELGASRLAPTKGEEIHTDYSIESSEEPNTGRNIDIERITNRSTESNRIPNTNSNTNSNTKPRTKSNIFAPPASLSEKIASRPRFSDFETISGRDISTISPNILQQLFNSRTPNVSDSSSMMPMSNMSTMPDMSTTPISRSRPMPLGPRTDAFRSKQNDQGPNINTDDLVNSLINDIMGDKNRNMSQNMSQSGGGKKKIFEKQNKKYISTVKEHRKMIGGSEINDTGADDMNGLFKRSKTSNGMSENEMRKIARAAANQKTKLHDEALAKISALLKDKDILTSRAVKAILYKEISDKHKEMTGLDKAAELLRIITDSKVDEALKRKDEVKAIVDYLTHKENERKKTDNSDKPKLNRAMKRPEIQYESSESVTASESITASESESLESDSENADTNTTTNNSDKTSEMSESDDEDVDEEDEDSDVTSVDTSEIEDTDSD